ncbi:hypothetical protein [Eubacterium aggregans]
MKLKSLKAAVLKHACWLSALVVMLAQNSDTCFFLFPISLSYQKV